MSKEFKTATELMERKLEQHIIGLCIYYKTKGFSYERECHTVVNTTIEDAISKVCKYGTLLKPTDVVRLQIYIGTNSYFIDIAESGIKLDEIEYEK